MNYKRVTNDFSFFNLSLPFLIFHLNRDICKDLSVKVVPIDKLDPSVSEFERHYKKVCIYMFFLLERAPEQQQHNYTPFSLLFTSLSRSLSFLDTLIILPYILSMHMNINLCMCGIN